MFEFSKILWEIFQPSHLIMVLFIVAWALFLVWERGGGLLLITSFILIVLTVLPISQMIIRPLEARFPVPRSLPSDIAGIIILGGGINPKLSSDYQQISMNSMGERVLVGIELANLYPNTSVVYSGGTGSLQNATYKEADYAVDTLEKAGVARERLISEPYSRNTYENFGYLRELIEPDTGAPWILVTSAKHMPRAVGVAQRFGFNVLPYPVDFQTPRQMTWQPRLDMLHQLEILDSAMKEWVGLLYYSYKGYITETFPK